jgi:hypothetical protein
MSALFNFKMLGSAALALSISTVSLWPEMASANIVFDFNGTCDFEGCPTTTDTATGVLTLADAYVFGTDLTAADFISFSYSSSDMTFDVTPGDTTVLAGGLNSDGSVNASGIFYVGGFAKSFFTRTDLFEATTPGREEIGFTFAFTNVTPPPTPVPEPSTWAMMLIGFAGLGYATTRRKGAVRAISA